MDSERLIHMDNLNEKLYRCMILECHEQYLHVLTDQGDHLKIKGMSSHKVGDKIYFLDEDIIDVTINSLTNKPVNFKSGMRALSALAAVFLIIVLINFSMSNITYAVISLDINPSIELKINKSGEVIRAKGFNSDAVQLLSKLHLNGQSYEKSIDEILNQALLLGYTINQHSVLIAVAPLKTRTEEMISAIEKNLTIYTERLNAEVKIGNQESYENVKNHNMSLGRNLISNEHPDIDENDLENMKIKDIFEYIEKSDEHKNEDGAEVEKDDETELKETESKMGDTISKPKLQETTNTEESKQSDEDENHEDDESYDD